MLIELDGIMRAALAYWLIADAFFNWSLWLALPGPPVA